MTCVYVLMVKDINGNVILVETFTTHDKALAYVNKLSEGWHQPHSGSIGMSTIDCKQLDPPLVRSVAQEEQFVCEKCGEMMPEGKRAEFDICSNCFHCHV